MAISVAALGWLGSEWDSFYPEDLPPEWRLDYYANEFFAVVVPHAEWSVLSDETLLGWQGAVPEAFRFYWELPPAQLAAAQRLQRLRANREFADHWGGVVELAPTTPAQQQAPAEATAAIALLRLAQPLALRPPRQAMEAAMQSGGSGLLLVVEAGAATSLRPARDLALLLGGS